VYRRSRLLLPILFAMVVSACIGSNTPAAAPPSSAAAPSASATPSGAPSSAPASESAAPESTAPETPAPTPIPTASTEATPSVSGADGAGSLADCSGNDDNRTFFGNAARDLKWPVYCAALPARWFVSAGSYARGSGGKLEISYKGPNGARLELHEGAFCTAADGCVPDGTEFGNAGFGDQTATLLHLTDGRIAAVVDRGEPISWLAIGDGLDDDQFAALTGALIRLD
jgi:hypothetical protein